MSKPQKADYDRHWNMQWNVQLGVRYHMHLQNYYARLGKFITAFTLLTSSTAFAVFYQSSSELAKWLAFIAALLQVAELVIDTKANAMLHASLRQRYLHLELALPSHGYITEKKEPRFKQERTQIEVDEPPIIKALLNHCHNELSVVHGAGVDYKLKCYERLIAFWCS